MSEKLKATVNKQVANWTVLYVKLHNYHWYVKGKDFFTLHEKFEELYTEAAEHIDDLAERLLAIQGSPVGTMKECLEMSAIKEADGSESSEQMVQNIYNDFLTVAEEPEKRNGALPMKSMMKPLETCCSRFITRSKNTTGC